MAYLRHGQIEIERIIKYQTVAVVLVSLPFAAQSTQNFWSSIIGGLIALVAVLYQQLEAFQPYTAQEIPRLVGSIVGSMVKKMFLTGVLFASAFKGLPWLEPMPVFVGFGFIYLLPWLGLAWHHGKENRAS